MGEKWIAVVGSHRKGKNTDLMVNYVIEGLNEGVICIKEGNCIIKDDITKL